MQLTRGWLNLVDAALMAAALEGSFEEDLHHAFANLYAHRTTAKGEDIGVVMGARVPRGKLIVCARCPDAGYLVANHR